MLFYPCSRSAEEKNRYGGDIMKLRVLIADPDPDLQRTITAALSQERDMEAAGFSSGGTETLSQIQSLRPDVVLLELVQPQLDGLSVLRRLAEAEQDSARHILSPSPATPERFCSACGSTRRRKRDRPPPSPDWPPRRRCRLPRPHIWKAPSPTSSTRWAYRRILKAFNTCVQGSFLRSAVRAPSPE